MARRAASGTPDPRPVLTRDRVVRAAVDLIERDGTGALSMRAVAAELGVAVMSLYNHVPNKAALLEGVAEHVVAGMELTGDPAEHWTDRARALARAFRKTAHDYPRCMSIVLTHKVDGVVGLRMAESAFAIAHDAGFGAADAVRITRAFMAYVIGSQLRDAGMAEVLDRHPGGPLADQDLDPAEFPNVLAAGAELARSDPEGDFEFGLDLLLGAVDALPR